MEVEVESFFPSYFSIFRHRQKTAETTNLNSRNAPKPDAARVSFVSGEAAAEAGVLMRRKTERERGKETERRFKRLRSSFFLSINQSKSEVEKIELNSHRLHLLAVVRVK